MRIKIGHIDFEKVLKGEDYQSLESAIRYLLSGRHVDNVKTLQVDAHSDVPKEWLKASADYVLHGLSLRELVTLYAYTTSAYEDIINFMNGGHNYKKLVVTQAAKTDPSKWSGAALDALKKLPEVKPFDTRLRGAVKNGTEADYDAVLADWLAFLKTKPKGWHLDRIQKEINRTNFLSNCVYLHQARVLGIKGLDEFKKRFTTLTASDWRKIMVQYVADMKAIFEGSPPLPVPLTVYRGVKTKLQRPRAGYVSTSLSKAQAEQFMDPEKKCCLLTLKIPEGTKVLPLFVLSRYPIEAEILLSSSLPRSQPTRRSSRK